MVSTHYVPPNFNNPYADLVKDIARQFTAATGEYWNLGKSRGATAFLPDGKKKNSTYPEALRKKFPNGVIAQEHRGLTGDGFWDFGVKTEGTEFEWTYTLNGPEGKKVRHTQSYRVIVALNGSTVSNYRASVRK